MTNTVATIPLQENDAQYYAGQLKIPGNGTNIYSFPTFNTTLVSSYTGGGQQISNDGNFSLHILPTSTTLPSAANKIPANLVYVTDPISNTINSGSVVPVGNFLFIQLSNPAIGDNYGSYGYLSLNDIIDNFLVAYVGQDKILQRVKRTDVLFYARRAMQELSYDTLPSAKSIETTIPTSLVSPLPQDYVNYVRLSWSDGAGVLHTIYPLNGLSGNPIELPIEGLNGVPTQDSFDSNLQAAQSIIEQNWKSANQSNLNGQFNPTSAQANVYDQVWWKQAYGQRYGLEPELSQVNGYFSINERLGTFNFSGNLSGRLIMIDYISDGLAYDLDSLVPKMIEDAMYSKIMSTLILPRRDVDPGVKQFYKRDAYVKIRNAKIRLSNLKLDEIVQVFRGQSKWIKH